MGWSFRGGEGGFSSSEGKFEGEGRSEGGILDAFVAVGVCCWGFGVWFGGLCKLGLGGRVGGGESGDKGVRVVGRGWAL